MKHHTLLLAALVLSTLAADRAPAHFLFLRILPPAEGGRAAEVYFSELAEAGDPRFIDKIAHTQLWLQKTPGKFEPLQVRAMPDRLRAHLPSSDSLMVVGSCQYGVLARPKQTAFLLRYYPKAMAGWPAELNQLSPHGKLPLEIVATLDGGEVRLVALMDGKPLPKAEFVTVDAKLGNAKLRADEKGQAVWNPAAAGVYSIFLRNTRRESGNLDGQKYEEIRDFATIAFAWPPERKGTDAAAVALYEEAMEARADWRDFPGFEAKIAGNLAGRRFDGTVAIDATGHVTFSDSDPSREETVAPWVEEQLTSIFQYRLGGRPKIKSGFSKLLTTGLRFAETPPPDHPFGPLLIFGAGKFAPSLRIKDRQIQVDNRKLDKENMTKTVMDNHQNKEGKFLPRNYQVQYWDAATGRLLRTETVQNRWQRVGSWDLPVFIQVASAGDDGLVVRGFTLSEHVLMRKKNSSPPKFLDPSSPGL